MAITIFVSSAIYIYAGLVISEFAFKWVEKNEPEYLWNLHKELKVVWDVKTTKLVVKIVLVFLWLPIFFPPIGITDNGFFEVIASKNTKMGKIERTEEDA